MDLSLLVEKVIGYLCFILGGSLILQRQLWVDWVKEIEKKPLPLLFSSVMGLFLGLIIVTVHNQWVWDLKVIVTIFGWVAVIKSTLYLLAPQFMLKLIPSESSLSRYCLFQGGMMVILSILILYGAYY